MKIINTPIHKPYTINHHCGAVLEVTPNDIIMRDADRDGSFYIFKCAYCNKDIFIDTKVINWNLG